MLKRCPENLNPNTELRDAHWLHTYEWRSLEPYTEQLCKRYDISANDLKRIMSSIERANPKPIKKD